MSTRKASESTRASCEAPGKGTPLAAPVAQGLGVLVYSLMRSNPENERAISDDVYRRIVTTIVGHMHRIGVTSRKFLEADPPGGWICQKRRKRFLNLSFYLRIEFSNVSFCASRDLNRLNTQ